jgi:GT2 family glycosyltransferase
MAAMTSLRPQVSVVIPAFGAPAPTVAAVRRLLSDDEMHLEVIAVDNGPGPGLAALLPASPRLHLVEPGFNSGFSGAINRGVDASRGEFVLFHNADLVLDASYMQALLSFMRDHPNAGCAAGKVRRPCTQSGAGGLLDSAGIAVRRDRSAYDRGEGEPAHDHYGFPEEVFAVSGAALFARRAALDDVAVDGHVLPPSFFMYKDDVDLCWRMRLRGWECWYIPTATATHARTGRGPGNASYLRAPLAYARNERRKAPHVRLHSLKNEWLLLLHNDGAASLLRDLPWVLARQLALLAATLLFAPRLAFRAAWLFATALPGALRWRRAVQRRAIVDPSEIRARWFAG